MFYVEEEIDRIKYNRVTVWRKNDKLYTILGSVGCLLLILIVVGSCIIVIIDKIRRRNNIQTSLLK